MGVQGKKAGRRQRIPGALCKSGVEGWGGTSIPKVSFHGGGGEQEGTTVHVGGETESHGICLSKAEKTGLTMSQERKDNHLLSANHAAIF